MFKKEKIRSKFTIFIFTVMVLKLLLMGMFSSDYQDKLFVPFVMDFLSQGGNAYQRFFEVGILNAFPYPPIMLFIQSVGAGIIRIFGVTNIFLQNFIFKIPSFIIDLIGLYVLSDFFPNKRRYIAVFYYASPMVIYSVYMHGQLDLIPMIFLIIAIYFLCSKQGVKSRYIGGIIFTAVALLCKLHILAALPIVFAYLMKRDDFKHALIYMLGVYMSVVLVISPFMSEGFLNTVLLNHEQGVLTKVFFQFDTVELYIPIVAVWFVYLLTFKIDYLNRELFLNLCGVVFAVLLAFCPTMPAWYVWIVPFVALFFASINEEKYKNIGLYIVLNILYLIYFVLLHNKGMVDVILLGEDLTVLKIDSIVLRNGIFTLLSGILIYLFVVMYQLGVASNNFYKRKNIPFTIGITGDSGAGKTTMIEIIERALGSSNLLYIEGDGDHRWERGEQFWDEYTALNPKANYLYRQAKDLQDLRTGGSIRRVDYDHDTGKFTSPKRLRAKKYVILCGLHALYLPQTRKHLDLKIYMDSDETLRRYWKIKRDTTKRGYSKEAVLRAIEGRMPDAQKYIYPQKKYADFIVRYYDKNLKDCMVSNHDVSMSVLLTLSADIDIEPLVDELKKNDINVNYEYSEDLRYQFVTLDADDMEGIKLPFEQIANRIIPQMEEITKEDFHSDINAKDGMIILFLLLIISNKMQEVV